MKYCAAFLISFLMAAVAFAAGEQDAAAKSNHLLDEIQQFGYSVQEYRFCGVLDGQMPEHQRLYNSSLWLAQTIALLPKTPDNAIIQSILTTNAIESAFSKGIARANQEAHPAPEMCVTRRQRLAISESVAKRVADDGNAVTLALRRDNHLR